MGLLILSNIALENHIILLGFLLSTYDFCLCFQVCSYCNPFPSLRLIVILASYRVPAVCQILFYKIIALFLCFVSSGNVFELEVVCFLLPCYTEEVNRKSKEARLPLKLIGFASDLRNYEF